MHNKWSYITKKIRYIWDIDINLWECSCRSDYEFASVASFCKARLGLYKFEPSHEKNFWYKSQWICYEDENAEDKILTLSHFALILLKYTGL